MSKILDNVDLGKAFDKFKAEIDALNDNYKNLPWTDQRKKAWKLGALETAVNRLLINCTGESLYNPKNPDDLKNLNI